MNKEVPLRNFSDYFFENISVNAPNQIQITSICNAKCIFCSNEQNPFEIKRCGFRSTDEIEKIVWSLPPIDGPIMLNESLPGRLSEGEAFLHPKFFHILKIIRSKFNNTLKITTNGSMLTPNFIKELAEYNPVEITISLPSVNLQYWKESYGLNDEQFYTALNAFQILNSYKVNVIGSVTPMPSWIGWEELENTFKFLSGNVKSVIIYAPGYTKESKIQDKLRYDKMELSLFLEKMSKKYSFIYSWLLDPRKALYINFDSITNNLMMAYERGKRNILWLTSESSEERFRDLLYKLTLNIPVNNTVLAVKNDAYGGNIECTGLWMITDLVKALDEYLVSHEKPDQVFLPRGFTDKYGFDLSGNNIMDFFRQYNQLAIWPI